MDASIARVLAERLLPNAPRNRWQERSRRNRSFADTLESSASADAPARAETSERPEQLERKPDDSDGVGESIDVTA